MTIVLTPITNTGERLGMTAILAKWRRMVEDAGTATWSNLEAQELLDASKTEFVNEPLRPQPRALGAGVTPEYKIYRTPYRNLEGTLSGSLVFRVHDGQGGTVGAYTVDCALGVITFSTDQANQARYLDASAYDLNAAAAEGWRERMGSKASLINFSTDGQSFSQAQWFDHCAQMAAHYDSLRPAGSLQMVRHDLTVREDDDE